MICFRLKCYNGHEYDSWFKDSKSYDDLQEKQLIACPTCGICEVKKAITAPNIVKSRGSEIASNTIDPSLKAREFIRTINRYVAENFENVGGKFIEEARKIAEGASSPRGIYGKAKPEEAKDLADEGIEVIVLPTLPSHDA